MYMGMYMGSFWVEVLAIINIITKPQHTVFTTHRAL
jgi:hypothetical protein